jgi:hypothetical protein
MNDPAAKFKPAAVNNVPHSGKPDEVIVALGISAHHIVVAVRGVLQAAQAKGRGRRSRNGFTTPGPAYGDSSSNTVGTSSDTVGWMATTRV